MATPKQNRSSLGTDFPKLENQPTFSFHIFLPFKSESRRSVDRVGSTLVAKYMKEQEDMATLSFEGQHKSSPSSLGVNIEEENLRYNKEITSRDNEELEKFQTLEN